MLGSGFAFRGKLVACLGVIGIAGNVAMQGSELVGVLLDSNWMTVAMTGAAVIICGSLIERHGVVIKLKIQALAGRWRGQSLETDEQLHLNGSDPELPSEAESNLAA